MNNKIETGTQYEKSRDERRLDAMARIINYIDDGKCVAVCFERDKNTLHVSANSTTIKKNMIRSCFKSDRLKEIYRNLTGGIGMEELKQTAIKLKKNKEWQEYYKQLGRMRIARDCAKVKMFLRGEGEKWGITDVPVQINSICGVENYHAELLIVEYFHMQTMDQSPGESGKELYIGVSLKCCPKCHTILMTYNGWLERRRKFGWRGFHKAYEGGWRLPKGLVGLKSVLQLEYRKLKYAQSPQRDEMVADDSDSEAEELK